MQSPGMTVKRENAAERPAYFWSSQNELAWSP